MIQSSRQRLVARATGKFEECEVEKTKMMLTKLQIRRRLVEQGALVSR